ncbi:two pore domain potassium channel family protein [Candidatus Uhrbacteria bacterium]|jgi:voltage-gated potassium channel|nr:two pore domain potassium channel family protein [Candidatus Uhrbacteria bacterium]
MVLAVLRHKRVGFLFVFTVVMLGLGTAMFSALEGWSAIDAFYFTVSTMTTVGFGDLTVTSDLAKLLSSVYMILSVPLLLIAIEFTVEVMYGNIHTKRKGK